MSAPIVDPAQAAAAQPKVPVERRRYPASFEFAGDSDEPAMMVAEDWLRAEGHALAVLHDEEDDGPDTAATLNAIALELRDLRAERVTLVAQLAAAARTGGMTFAGFARENRARCEAPTGFNHPLGSWSLSDWMTATLGELGEAANVAKKLNRVRDGIPGNKRGPDELRRDLADEIADAFIYLDLLAQSQGFDLGAAVRAKFDAKSVEIGYVADAAPCVEGVDA